jgi:acetyltransferase-like isoleucine patch superfamily enzyme
MLRWFLYTYPSILGLIKAFVYKCAYGKKLHFAGLPHIARTATIRMRKGTKIKIGRVSNLADGTILSVAGAGEFLIGDNSSIGFYTIITCHYKISIGNNVMIAPHVSMYDHDHEIRVDGNMKDAGYTYGEIVIGDNVWIGDNVTILKGVHIGSGSVIAAGSLVNKDVPSNSIYYNKREKTIKPLHE